jgi:hypothetical protein
LKIHPGSPENPPGSQLVKNTSSTVLEQSFCTFATHFTAHSVAPISIRTPVPVHSAKGKSSGHTPFLTSKQDKKSHGVPDDPEFDAGNFEFAPGCLQPIQPTTLFLN